MTLIRYMCGLKKKSEELRELLLEPVSLMIKKSRSRWFGNAERKDDTDWVKPWMTLDDEGIKHSGQRWDCVNDDVECLDLLNRMCS